MQVVSLATRATLPQARVLARSLARHEPDWPLQVVLVGHDAGARGDREPFALRRAEDELDIDIRELICRYAEDELIAILVPRLLQAHARAHREPVLHLPPSAWVLGRLQPYDAQLRSHGVLLAPRCARDLPADGLEPTAKRLAASGRIAANLMAVDGSPAADTFLRWWCARLDEHFGSLDGRRAGGRVEDRFWAWRFLELAPARFGAATLAGPGLYLSQWNLHEHALTGEDDRVLVDGRETARLLDLPGFEPGRPYRLAATASRARVSRSPALRRLTARYAAELDDAGWRDLDEMRRQVGRRLANGLVFDEAMWALSAQAYTLGEDFGDLFTPEGTDAFVAWLHGPAPRGARHGVNRYVFHRVARERPDVPRTYPDLDGADAAGYVAWCRSFGRSEMELPDEFLPPGDGAAPAEPVVAAARVPDGGRPAARAGDAIAGNGAAPATSEVAAPTASGEANGTALGVRVTGYLSHTLGLGSAARGYASALAAAGVPVTTASVPLHHLELPVELAAEYGRHLHDDIVHAGGHGYELIAVNADELPSFVERLGGDYFQGPRIGIWGWEVNRIPDRWRSAFELIDEIWVYSRFMAENIGAVAPVPVTVLPPPVSPPVLRGAPLRLGVPDGFLFLFVFDYMSTTQRKNPVGLVEAFRSAFSPQDGAHLLIKTINAPLRPLAEEELLWACHGREDIHVIDRSLTGPERDALMAACDCYVSLHRSEGFGLTLAEAMSIGKPVIATGYSGNVDFMTAENSYLVDYEIVRVGPDCEIYPADGEWAEPDVEQAARLMRGVYDDPAQAHRLAQQAQLDVVRLLSPEATGRAMRERLLAMGAERPLAASAT